MPHLPNDGKVKGQRRAFQRLQGMLHTGAGDASWMTQE